MYALERSLKSYSEQHNPSSSSLSHAVNNNSNIIGIVKSKMLFPFLQFIVINIYFEKIIETEILSFFSYLTKEILKKNLIPQKKYQLEG